MITKTSSGNAGFSLMEVLVAMALLGIVYTTLFSLLSGSLKNAGKIDERGRMLRSAHMKLNELVLRCRTGAGQSVLTGTFGSKYRWQARIEPIDMAEGPPEKVKYSVAKVRLLVSWEGTSGPQRYDLETMTWMQLR